MLGTIGIAIVIIVGLLVGIGFMEVTGMLYIISATVLVIGGLVIGIMNYGGGNMAKDVALVVGGLSLGLVGIALASVSALGNITNAFVVIITPIFTLLSVFVIPIVAVVGLGLIINNIRQ